MDLRELVKIAVERKASDLHIKVGGPPVIRIDNKLIPLNEKGKISQEDAIKMIFSVMNESQRERFREKREIDMAYSVAGLGRFRVNVFQQRSTVGMVMRVIPMNVLSIRQGTNFYSDREVMVYLKLKAGESLVGQSWTIGPDTRTNVPNVVKRWRPNPKFAPQQKSFANGYAMRLEFVNQSEDLVQGRVYLALPDTEQSVIAGQFNAEIRQARPVAAVPDVTDVMVDVVWEPPWSRDRMSEAAKLQLGMF